MNPKPPINVTGLRLDRPRPVPVARSLQVRPEDHERYHAANEAHAEHLRRFTPGELEDGAYDDDAAARPFADRHPFLNAVGWLLLVAIATMVGAFLVSLFFAGRVYGQTLPATQPAPTQAPVRFGVYSQRLDLLPQWRALGFTFFLYSETQGGKVDQRTYRKTAAAAGWDYFDTYLDDGDAADPHLLGWLPHGHDEWNRRKPDLAPIKAEIAKLAALNARTGAGKLILVNADGMGVTTALWERPPYNGVANGEREILTAGATAWSLDWYPVVNTAAATPDQVARRPMYLPAQGLWRLATWGQAWGVAPRARLVILEANKGYKSPLRVTPAQMTEQLEYVLGDRAFPIPDAGARPLNVQSRMADLVVYWTANGQDGPGFDWDTTTAEQRDALRQLVARYGGNPALAAALAENAALRADRDARAAAIDAVRRILATQPTTQQGSN